MTAEDFSLDFDGRTLTYTHAGGITTYVGGESPKIHATGKSKYAAHQDPDFPVMVFAEEMEDDINFWNDPIDCTNDGVVLLGSRSEVLLDCLPKQQQDWAIKQKHISAFQRTIPYQIKERLMQVYCCRWAHYEIFASSPTAMALFDKDPDLIMKAARSHKRHSLGFNPYV